jgi:hypothetical protein
MVLLQNTTCLERHTSITGMPAITDLQANESDSHYITTPITVPHHGCVIPDTQGKCATALQSRVMMMMFCWPPLLLQTQVL